MAFHVRDRRTDAAVRQLAARRGKSITETIRDAVEAELKRDSRELEDVLESIRPIQEKFKALPVIDPRSEKEISDDLSGGL